MKIPIYLIADENGQLWRDEVDFDKDRLLTRFVRDWLPRAKIDGGNAYLIWRTFAAASWNIIEREVELPNENAEKS